MRLEMEVGDDDWDRIQAGGTVMIADAIQEVTVRLNESLLTAKPRCLMAEFCAASVAVGKAPTDGRVHLRVWLAPEEAGEHVGNES